MMIPIPASSDALRNRAREWDAALIESGGRSLESASISRGNFRVIGGNVIIGVGGTLELIDGNLILGEGKIEGRALADQMQAVNIYQTHSGGHPSNTSRQNMITHSITKPAWASRAVVMVSVFAQTLGTPIFDIFLHINNVEKLRYPAIGSKTSDPNKWPKVALSTYSATMDVTNNLDFRLSVQNWENGAPGTNSQRLNGVVIWQR